MESALFSRLARISGQCEDFEILHAQKCNLAKTCCAWAEKSFLYNFHGKRTVFPFWREFEASVTILRTLTVKNTIWPKRAAYVLKRGFCTILMESEKRAAHDLKRAFCTIFMESALFSLFWREYDANVRILRTLTVKTAIWPKRAAHVLKRALCTILMESALFSRFGENFRPLWGFLRTCTVKNVIWPKRAAHEVKRAFCTIFMESALFSRFGENFRPVWGFRELWRSKLRFAKTCCAWAEKSVLYNFHGKRTVFPFWREFEASFTILKTLTVKSALWPKRAAHDLKRAFCTIFMKSALFSCFEENMMPMWGFWELWRSRLRFAQTCCACPENSV